MIGIDPKDCVLVSRDRVDLKSGRCVVCGGRDGKKNPLGIYRSAEGFEVKGVRIYCFFLCAKHLVAEGGYHGKAY